MILILRCLSQLATCLQYFQSTDRNQDKNQNKQMENSEISYPDYIKTRRVKTSNHENDGLQIQDNQNYLKVVHTMSSRKSEPDYNIVSDFVPQKFSEGFQETRNNIDAILDFNTLQTVQQSQKKDSQENNSDNTKESNKIYPQNKLNLQSKHDCRIKTFMIIHQKISQQENEQSNIQNQIQQQNQQKNCIFAPDFNSNDPYIPEQDKKENPTIKKQIDLQTRIKKKLRKRRNREEEDIYSRSPYRVNLPKDFIGMLKQHKKSNKN